MSPLNANSVISSERSGFQCDDSIVSSNVPVLRRPCAVSSLSTGPPLFLKIFPLRTPAAGSPPPAQGPSLALVGTAQRLTPPAAYGDPDSSTLVGYWGPVAPRDSTPSALLTPFPSRGPCRREQGGIVGGASEGVLPGHRLGPEPGGSGCDESEAGPLPSGAQTEHWGGAGGLSKAFHLVGPS